MFVKPKFGRFIGRTNGKAIQDIQTNIFKFYVSIGFYYTLLGISFLILPICFY